MKLNYNEKELHQLLQDFHDLTKLTLTLYDPEGEWIFSYPTKENCFCNCIKTSPEGAALCEASDRASFEAAKASGECVIYKCHAGLIEAANRQRRIYHRLPYDGTGCKCSLPGTVTVTN